MQNPRHFKEYLVISVLSLFMANEELVFVLSFRRLEIHCCGVVEEVIIIWPGSGGYRMPRNKIS